jgi:hypothetical protein
VLKGEALVAAPDRLEILPSLPHGHVAAALGLARKLGSTACCRSARSGSPASRWRWWWRGCWSRRPSSPPPASSAMAAHWLGAMLGLGEVNEDELYRALDLLGVAQPKIETLARRHLEDGCLVLYDLTSSWLEGRRCKLARFGYSRDSKRDKLQIVFGLLCTAEGCPIAVEVFAGDTANSATLVARPGGAGGRSGHDHHDSDRGRPRARRPGLDHDPAGAGNPGPGRRGRPLAALAVG